MVKVEAIMDFSFNDYDKVKETLESVNKVKNKMIFKGDKFECDMDTAEYLTGKNQKNLVAVKVIEIKPEIKEVESTDIVVDEIVKTINEGKPVKKSRKSKKASK